MIELKYTIPKEVRVMRKTVFCVLISLLCLSFCSCKESTCEHVWSEATCTEPKTCSRCGETSGNALGNTFDDTDTEHPATCSRCGASNGVSAPSEPEVNTYTAYFIDDMGEGDKVWEIRGVFAEGNYYAPNGYPSPLRVFYVVSENSATLLKDLAPGDYAYRGSYTLSEGGHPTGIYKDIAPYGHFEEYTQDSETYTRSGGYYENLPKGSWYFGSVRFSDGFFIVVGDFEAAKNGTVPEN